MEPFWDLWIWCFLNFIYLLFSLSPKVSIAKLSNILKVERVIKLLESHTVLKQKPHRIIILLWLFCLNWWFVEMISNNIKRRKLRWVLPTKVWFLTQTFILYFWKALNHLLKRYFFTLYILVELVSVEMDCRERQSIFLIGCAELVGATSYFLITAHLGSSVQVNLLISFIMF